MFSNNLEISIIRQGISENFQIKNSICDDFLLGDSSMYVKMNPLVAVLLPDGPRWSGWTWDPRDPWLPYSCLINHPNDSEAVNLYQSVQNNPSWDGSKQKTKMYYQWSKLDIDFTLKAIGLTQWSNFDATATSLNSAYCSIPIAALAILPQPLTIKGRNGGSQVPDILQVSYYVSLVGV